jgi:heat shock protein HslJ
MMMLMLFAPCSVIAGDIRSEIKEHNEKLSPLAETYWYWVQTLYSDGKKVIPTDHNRYTLKFQSNGDLNIKADCNLKGGRYVVDGNRLTLEITHSTMAACEDGSLEDTYVRDLSEGTKYLIKNGDLDIGLKHNSGTMKFSRQ